MVDEAQELHEAVERQVAEHVRDNPNGIPEGEFLLVLQLNIAMRCMEEMRKELGLTLKAMQLASDCLDAQQKKIEEQQEKIEELSATLEMLGRGHS